jgi:hypothetical protein
MTSRRTAALPAGARRRPGPVLTPERGEQIRAAAETMAIGALFLVFCLPVVTAGAAWCAAAEIVAAWHRHQEPPLWRTFTRVVRRDLRAGFALQCGLLAVAAVVWSEVHVVLDSRMPGYGFEAGALTLLGAGVSAFVLLTVASRAAAGSSWREAVHAAAARTREAPSTLLLVVTALAFVAALIAVIPAFAGFMAGPLAFAVSAVVARDRGAGEGRAHGPHS